MKYRIRSAIQDRHVYGGNYILESITQTGWNSYDVKFVFRGRLDDCEKVRDELLKVLTSQNDNKTESDLPFPEIKPESWEKYRTIDEDGYVMAWEEMPRTNSLESDYEWTIGQFKHVGEILDYDGSKTIWKI